METVLKMNDNGSSDTISGDVGGHATVLVTGCFLLRAASYWLSWKT